MAAWFVVTCETYIMVIVMYINKIYYTYQALFHLRNAIGNPKAQYHKPSLLKLLYALAEFEHIEEDDLLLLELEVCYNCYLQ